MKLIVQGYIASMRVELHWLLVCTTAEVNINNTTIITLFNVGFLEGVTFFWRVYFHGGEMQNRQSLSTSKMHTAITYDE